MGKHVLRMDAQHPALVHLAAIVVGPSDPGLVCAGWIGFRCRERRGGGAGGSGEIRRCGAAPPRGGRARHVVLLRLVAVLDIGLAGEDTRTRALLPGRRACHRLRHHFFLGRPHDDAGAAFHGGCAVPHGLHPCARARRAWPEDVEVARQHHRPARSDRSLWLRRAALHIGRVGLARPRHQARRESRRELAQLRDQIMECGALCRDERLRPGAGVRSALLSPDGQPLDRRRAARLRRGCHGVPRNLSLRRGGASPLSLPVGHVLRLVSRIHQADPAGR